MWGLLISLTLAILIVALGGGCAGKQVACLEVSGEGPERVLTRLPVEPGVPFSLEFINSIYLAPVRETLVYEPPGGISIVMVESPSDGVFEYYGLEPDGTGKALMHRQVGDFKLRSHDYTNHPHRCRSSDTSQGTCTEWGAHLGEGSGWRRVWHVTFFGGNPWKTKRINPGNRLLK